MSPPACPPISGAGGLDFTDRLRPVALEHLLDDLADPPERNAALQERGHGRLIGGVEHGRSRAAGATSGDSQTERPKHVAPDRLEGERSRSHWVETAHAGIR